MAERTLEQFLDEVSEIMPLISREFFRRQESGFFKVKITMPQFIIMELLHKRGESSMTDLAGMLNVTTAAMTGIIDRLVRDGYVSRNRGTEDRRVVMAELTPKGCKVVSTMADDRKRLFADMFGKLSHEERESYLNILRRIKENIS